MRGGSAYQEGAAIPHEKSLPARSAGMSVTPRIDEEIPAGPQTPVLLDPRPQSQRGVESLEGGRLPGGVGGVEGSLPPVAVLVQRVAPAGQQRVRVSADEVRVGGALRGAEIG